MRLFSIVLLSAAFLSLFQLYIDPDFLNNFLIKISIIIMSIEVPKEKLNLCEIYDEFKSNKTSSIRNFKYVFEYVVVKCPQFKEKVFRNFSNSDVILEDILPHHTLQKFVESLIASNTTIIPIVFSHPDIKKRCHIAIEEDSSKNLSTYLFKHILNGDMIMDETSVFKSVYKQNGKVSLVDIKDRENRNLLMLAAKENRHDIVPMLFRNGFNSSNVNDKDNDDNMAADYAWMNYDDDDEDVSNEYSQKRRMSDDILSCLLGNDSMFPKNFRGIRASDSVRNYLSIINLMQDCIRFEKTKLLSVLITNFENVRHFYDAQNKSLIRYALEIENFEMVMFLTGLNITEGQYEDNYKLYGQLIQKIEILQSVKY